MKVQAFYTAAWVITSYVICKLSRGEWSHVGILFTLTRYEWEDLMCRIELKWRVDVRPCPDGLYRVYFESIATTDPLPVKRAFVVPTP